jgi:hypothetical protein
MFTHNQSKVNNPLYLLSTFDFVGIGKVVELLMYEQLTVKV